VQKSGRKPSIKQSTFFDGFDILNNIFIQ